MAATFHGRGRVGQSGSVPTLRSWVLSASNAVTIASRVRLTTMARTTCDGRLTMTINKDKIDDAALALLYITLHDGYRAWKGVDWGVLGRLHEKG
jgi:hypothetical protein